MCYGQHFLVHILLFLLAGSHVMTKKMASDVNGDDCILISESSDEKCTDDKSETISVTAALSTDAANIGSSSLLQKTSKHYCQCI